MMILRKTILSIQLVLFSMIFLPVSVKSQGILYAGGGALSSNDGRGFKASFAVDPFPARFITTRIEVGGARRYHSYTTYHSLTQWETFQLKGYYLEATIPLVLNLTFDDWRFLVSSGLGCSWALNAKARHTYFEDFFKKNEIEPDTENFSGYFTFGIGVEKTIARNRKLFLQLQRQYGLNDILREKHATFYFNDFSVLMGIGFPVHFQK